MDAARWQIVNELFHQVIARAVGQRRAWLDRACAGDRTLVDEVDRLVRAHEHAQGFLDTIHLPEAPGATEGHPALGLDFPGTDRFAVRRRLGVGGMGVVFEVHDRLRDETVALKTLLHVNAAEIYRLKQEFRSLADVAHPNLVSLYELFVEGEHCFFTMELVTGVTIVDYTRGHGGGTTERSSLAERVGRVFPQLVDGVSELHRQGKLHRDIKPSNVLVTPQRRVVVLDFGLIAEASSRDLRERRAGTPAYMSPEQILGADLSNASDWYSVGVTLYEALTGEVPFNGASTDVLRSKTEADPPAPAAIAADVPEELSAICMGLLRRDPLGRLSGKEAARRLGRSDTSTLPGATTVREAPFVGRARPLEVLTGAFEETRQGRTSVVYVTGPSGIGKTALLRCFVDRLAKREDVVLLSGRCYEHESVPYKALDGVVDSLSHYLTTVPEEVVEALLPADRSPLGRLFPVLRRLDALAKPAAHDQEMADPRTLRRRAFAALRELLAGLSNRQPLVICIDDLHWADADSVALFEDLLRPPHSPALLAIACCRSEEIASKPFLQSLVGQAQSGAAIALPLGPLTDDEASHLIGCLMPVDSLVTPDERRHITREAEGNPFFLDQLARHAVAAEVTPGKGPTLGEMIEVRLRRLPDGAQHFLEALAICGRPMPPSWVYEACRLTGDERPFVAVLRAAHLVRSSGSAQRVEIYHDRIREALILRLDAGAFRAVHGAIVETLVSNRVDDPDTLFEHYLGAGDHDAAAMQADLAAEKASAVFAFDRAALFYGSALELAPMAAGRGAWKKRLATALANARRPAEAGEMFVEAAAHAQPLERIELLRRGAEQFLIGGYIDRGLDVIRTVLDAAGMRLAQSPRVALGSLILRRAQLRWRGLSFMERSVDQVPRDTLFRIDTCWAVVTGLAMVDSLRAPECNTRHLLMALDAGEPYRIARALAVESFFSATAGGRTRARTAELAEQARSIAERVGHPHAIALSALTAAGSACLNGEWRRALEFSDRAMDLLRKHCIGATWELNAGHYFLIGALMYLGEFAEVSRRLPTLLQSAHDSGNLHIETDLRLRMMTIVWLVADDPDEAKRQADEIMRRWSQTGFHIQHYRHLQALAMTALYRGDGEGAWRLIAEHWPSLQRTFLLRVQYYRIETSYLRARCALAAAEGSDRRRFLAIARREVHRMEQEHMAWSDPFAWLVGAGLAKVEGQGRVAERRLIEAAEGFDREGLKLYATIARRSLGSLLGGDRGRQMIQQSDEWMASQTIKNPQRLARMLAPGFDNPPA